MGVVEHEHVATGHAPVRRLALHHLLQQFEAARQRALEAALLFLDHPGDEGALLLERRVRRPRGLDGRRHDAREERLAHAEHVPEVDRAPQHATQHVAAAFVAGQHAILDEERSGARVLRDHAQRPCRLGRAVGVIGVPGRRLGRRQHAAQLVGFVGRARALQYPRHAFEARAGVDVLRGQRLHRSVGVQVERHEHEVPDFEEVRRVEVDLPVGEAGFAIDVVAEVVVQLGARAARPRLTGVPEVPLLGGVAEDAIGGHAARQPQVVRLVVVGVDGDPQAGGVDAEFACQEVPCPVDGVGLEVVAEREVAEHLEERQVRVVADLLDVGGAEALLHRSETRRRRLLKTEEVRLELHHPRRGEQQRGVAVRDQRRGRDAAMQSLPEVAEERRAEFFDGQRDTLAAE